ncbi:PEP-CTERM sorting domain-containing protein [Prosthecobacter fusiformis]|nr:PEP-CTERM sorting domain-containing protein [Prosthecobacter fusiformis]
MKRPLLHRLVLPLAAMAAWVAIPRADASTIFWESGFVDGDFLLYDAAGQPLGGEFSFEIGSFDNGFVPTAENLNDWAANWKVFDRAFDATPNDPDDGDPDGWSAGNGFFTRTVEHTADEGSSSPYADPADTFQQGETVYLWVYNTKDRITTTEWALVTDGDNVVEDADNWVFPDPADPVDVSYTWQLDDADVALHGSLNGTTGGGQAYTLQTSLVPVPEPGSFLLVAMTGLGVLLSRRRPRHSAPAH